MIFVKPTPTNGSPDDTNNGTVNNNNNADNDDNDDAFLSHSIENVIRKKSTYSADAEERKKRRLKLNNKRTEISKRPTSSTGSANSDGKFS